MAGRRCAGSPAAYAPPLAPTRVLVFLPIAWQVREYVTRELAQRLRPELEAAVAVNDDGAPCCAAPCCAVVWYGMVWCAALQLCAAPHRMQLRSRLPG